MFDAATVSAVRSFQASRGLPVTGMVDAGTWVRLIVRLPQGATGEAVKVVQRQLNAKRRAGLTVDGRLAGATVTAVRPPARFGRRDLVADAVACFSEKPLDEGWIRVSVLANHDRWSALGADEYALSKQRSAAEAIASAARFVPDWTAHEVFRDVFTPRTIRAFTSHAGGAVYGSPKKHLDGETGIGGLFLCGTDQGYLGVIGALVSGVTMANRHVLLREVSR